MARVFITGSADGLGLLAAQQLAAGGHAVTLHARSEARAADTRAALPAAEDVVIGDLATIAGMRSVAERANALGRYDAVIHNAGVGYREPRTETADELERLFAINVLAPYVLTALMQRPNRLIYVASGMHTGGRLNLADAQWHKRRWNGTQAYADSKLCDILLAFGIARRWPDVYANALEPGWVPTKMGGASAPDDLELGAKTQAWLAVSDDPAALVSGRYFFHQQQRSPAAVAASSADQDALLAYCEDLSGIAIA